MTFASLMIAAAALSPSQPLAGEMMGEVAVGILNRADEQGVPEGRAIAFVVEYFSRDGAALL